MAAPALVQGVEAPASLSAETVLPPPQATPPAASVSSGEQPGAPIPANGTPPSTSGLVVFKASGPSWVQVTDAKGTVTLRRLMAAGETAGASGSPPLAVTVGSASATSVQVRGKPYDLAAVAKDNVARFEVK
jgi:cytoskeleton protein RodZ